MIYKYKESVKEAPLFTGCTIQESSLALTDSHDALRGHIKKALMDKHGVTDSWSMDTPYVQHVFPSHVVYQHKNETYKAPYSVDKGSKGSDPKVTVGVHKKVHVAYADTKEGATESRQLIINIPDTVEEDTVALDSYKEGFRYFIKDTEGKPEGGQVFESVDFDPALMSGMNVKEGAKALVIPIKLIQEGWGSCAYYSKAVLERDGPNVFKKGTHMQWNHPTASEEASRPEGNLDNLAAVLTEAAKWNENGPKGPGLYANAKVFSDYAQMVLEKGPHMGVSINAYMNFHEGEVNGRKGKIADRFIGAESVDFVTKPGAGGAPIVPVSESDRGKVVDGTLIINNKEGITMTEAEIKALESENAQLKAEKVAREAADVVKANNTAALDAVETVLKEAKIQVSNSLLRRVCVNPVIKEGKVDLDWVKDTVKIVTEGMPSGKVTGMGGEVKTQEATDEELDKEMAKTYESLGMPKAGLDIAVKGGR